ncbi:MAG: hypothetical protein QOI71_1497 [Gaiellales bacterium]|jgi:hypothetical protein|nr:hypothetical protein [Gaiellales bacterium]
MPHFDRARASAFTSALSGAAGPAATRSVNPARAPSLDRPPDRGPGLATHEAKQVVLTQPRSGPTARRPGRRVMAGSRIRALALRSGRVPVRARIPVLVAGCAVLLWGCGSSNAARTTGGSSAAGTTLATSNGEAAKPAAQILADSAAAFGAVHSYRVQLTGITMGQPLRLSLTVGSPTTSDVVIAQGPTSYETIYASGAVYLRAGEAFWVQHGGARAAALSGRWVRGPASAPPPLFRVSSRFGGEVAV